MREIYHSLMSVKIFKNLPKSISNYLNTLYLKIYVLRDVSFVVYTDTC